MIVPGRTSSSAHGFGGPWGPVDVRPMLPQSLGKPAFASFKVIPDEAALKQKILYLFIWLCRVLVSVCGLLSSCCMWAPEHGLSSCGIWA